MNNPYSQQAAPITPIKADRGFGMYLLLSLVTCGIYHLVIMTVYSSDINTIASRYDGRNTMNFCLVAFILGPLTGSIFTFIWHHTFSERIGIELKRRNISYEFGASTFWLWYVLGALILVGPFVYMYKLIQSMNMLAASYNQYG